MCVCQTACISCCHPQHLQYSTYAIQSTAILRSEKRELLSYIIYNWGKWPTWRTILFTYMLISILYMFRATSCPSSGESIVSIQHLVHVTLWPSSMQVRKELPDLHTKRSPAQSDMYQMYWYNWFSWWWAWGYSKYVENWNKHKRKKNCASSWSFTRIIPRCTANRTQKTYIIVSIFHPSHRQPY
jgi:hypothetical protein